MVPALWSNIDRHMDLVSVFITLSDTSCIRPHLLIMFTFFVQMHIPSNVVCCYLVS